MSPLLTYLPVNVFLKQTLPTYSVWVLIIISYKRYRKLVFPFKVSVSKKTLSIVLVILLIVCTGFYVPYMESGE